jgi:predicted PurR-regulated permease PerM
MSQPALHQSGLGTLQQPGHHHLVHPIVTFGSTTVGTALAGILGATLSAPIVAMLISIMDKRLAEHKDMDRTA